MPSIIEALELLASQGWWKEWQNPAWKQFILTGDEKHLKKLPKFTQHTWLPTELLSALVAIEDWTKLLQQSSAQTAVGLKESNPLDSVFALKPAAWGERGYDAVTQIFAWLLADAQQRSVLLEIGFDEFTERAIKFLESAAPDSLQGALVIGRVQRTPRGLSLHPYTVHHQNGNIIHLCLDNLKPTSTKVVATPDEEEEGFEDE